MSYQKKTSVGQIVLGVLLGIVALGILAFAGVGIYSTVKYVQDKKPAQEETEKTPEDQKTQQTMSLEDNKLIVYAN